MNGRYLLLGYGSIGRRHAYNLLALLPGAKIAIVDPLSHLGVSLDEALEYPDLCGAIIASPTDQHLSQLLALQARRIPVYCEKPVCTIAQWKQPENRDELGYLARQVWKCAVGFQYRYHPAAERLRRPRPDRLSFTAQDDLIKRYGATVAETMASHSIDLALFAQGAARYADLRTDGRTFGGSIFHRSGAVSDFDLRIDRGPRRSALGVTYERGGSVNLSIDADQGMYPRALAEWLKWTLEHRRPERLAMLADGLHVMELIAEARR